MNLQDHRFIDIPISFRFQAGVIRLLVPMGVSKDEILRELRDGAGDNPFVLDDGKHRSLHFDMMYVQSMMRISDPCALEIAYTRHMMSFLLFNSAPQNIALLGLGGGSLAKYCYRHLSFANITAVEANPQVIAFREQFMVPRDDSRFRVICADGQEYVKRAKDVDVLLIDAYDSVGVAPSLNDIRFFENAYRCLSANGIAVMNLAGGKQGRSNCVSMLRNVFADNVTTISVQADGNHVAFAFKNDGFVPSWGSLECSAGTLEEYFGLPFTDSLRKLKGGYRFRKS
jgi:spermidine synthase